MSLHLHDVMAVENLDALSLLDVCCPSSKWQVTTVTGETCCQAITKTNRLASSKPQTPPNKDHRAFKDPNEP